ncbi:MAG TPA: Rne/Rng family ribonuclease [Nocardioidaceae bacterium]|nr:Rne/Rng family ribonuclease [Nocardioidaceae bacterium]
MLDDDNAADLTGRSADTTAPAAAGDQAGDQTGDRAGDRAGDAEAAQAPVKKAARKTTKKAATKSAAKSPAKSTAKATRSAAKSTATSAGKKTTAKRSTKKAAPAAADAAADAAPADAASGAPADAPPDASAEAAAGAAAATPTEPADEAPETAPAKRVTKKAATKKAAAKKSATKSTAKKSASKSAAASTVPTDEAATGDIAPGDDADPTAAGSRAEQTGSPDDAQQGGPATAVVPLFQPPEPVAPTRKRASRKKAAAVPPAGEESAAPEQDRAATGAPEEVAGAATADDTTAGRDARDGQDGSDEPGDGEGGGRRRRRRGGRRRRTSGDAGQDDNGAGGEESAAGDDSDESSGRSGGRQGRADEDAKADKGDKTDKGGQAKGKGGKDDGPKNDKDDAQEGSSSSRRRRRRRRSGDGGDTGSDDPENTVTKVRKGRSAEDEITALSGSTRLEAKKQRRREGREAGRRRAPIVSEAEFLARRESVDRVMVIRQRKDLTQIAVLEDRVLVEHYVARESQTSLIGNVYLGRVQNVLPSMEAAFIDIGKGRNAVLYAGEVNWSALGHKDGQPRKIESVLKSGQTVLVQVTKDPVGHKGARLTSQISLPGRFLVYVPDGTTSGISRKLPDTERSRLKALLKEIVPESAGVIVRTAAEGASEEELTHDVERLTARWSDIEAKAGKGNAPQLLYGEPDLTLKVVRDLFTEDFRRLVVAGDDAWDMVQGYVHHVAPDLEERLERYQGERDVFAEYRIDEQIDKALDRKVWLPSGGSLIIDRTEAMTVVDVNTGKFTGSGGNLEETVTKNNLEAAEEMVRQLRLRDIGGIIVVDFIDMVLESNRDLVLRRMVECLGRDRTRHQVAEVTSLGLVQMTRKRIGTGLLEAFSEACEHCGGRGLLVHHEPIEPGKKDDGDSRRGRRGGRAKGKGDGDDSGSGKGSRGSNGQGAQERGSSSRGDANGSGNGSGVPSPKEIAAKASEHGPVDPVDVPASDAAAGETSAADAASQAAPSPTAEEQTPPASRAEQSGTGESQPEPAAPRTVTRKRSARRAQGPVGEAAVLSAPLVTAEAATTTSDSASEQNGATAPAADEPASSTSRTEAPSGPEGTGGGAVVATVRRRVARREAGPPAGTPGTSEQGQVSDAGSDAGSGDGAAEASGDGKAAETPSVPVKKRGSRRR